MTQITTIFDSVAAFSLTVNGSAPTVRNYDELKNKVNSADLPMRLLMITGSQPGQARDFQFIAMGKTSQVKWGILDRLLIKPVAQGAGLEDVSEDLVLYMDSYVEAMRLNRKLASQSVIISARLEPVIATWAGVDYFAVDCYLEIENTLSSQKGD